MLPPGATVPAIRLGLVDSSFFGAQGSWEGPLRCSVALNNFLKTFRPSSPCLGVQPVPSRLHPKRPALQAQ